MSFRRVRAFQSKRHTIQRVAHGLKGFLVQNRALVDAFVQGKHGCDGGVRVLGRVGDHVQVLIGGGGAREMLETGGDDAVADGLGDDVLRVGGVLEAELGRDIRQGDAGVGERDRAQAGLDDVVSEAGDERERAVGGECALSLGLCQNGRETCKVSDTNGLGQGQVRGERTTEDGRGGEGRTRRHVAHEQLNDEGKLSSQGEESWCLRRWRGRSESSLEVNMGGGIVQLDRSDTGLVEVPAGGPAGKGHALRRPGDFIDQVRGGSNGVGLQMGADDGEEEDGLGVRSACQDGRTVERQKTGWTIDGGHGRRQEESVPELGEERVERGWQVRFTQQRLGLPG